MCFSDKFSTTFKFLERLIQLHELLQRSVTLDALIAVERTKMRTEHVQKFVWEGERAKIKDSATKICQCHRPLSKADHFLTKCRNFEPQQRKRRDVQND